MPPFLVASIAANMALIAGIVGVIVGIAGIVSVVLVMSKYKALEASLSLFGTANAELREQVQAARDERHEMRAEFDKKLADERAECARSLGELQGQVTVLTANLGRDIAASVIQAFKDGQASTPATDMTTVTATTHTTAGTA